MRLAWYAGASTALAAGVVVSAFHQRANFYSAMVYLYQSNLCMMILVNLIALVYSSFVYSLQRVCFGQLRAIEVEQLYERAWFAVTETCLAMTIFRDEFGGFFIVMFVALLTGKVWGWIGEGRIEALEQQPPANPRLFHTRLIISLSLSLAYDTWLLYYAIKTVIDQARPDMMVMFLFEFAVLLVTSLHTALRYGVILLDMRIVKKQTAERLQERRRQVREERADILRRREEGEPDDGEPLPDEEDVDEMDIEVPGWETKGQYVLALDLWTDFTKLCIYAVFFFVLLSFYGLPLHIIRDLFMTVRSFVKRLGALMKYRQAVKDMNRYADATEEELTRENTCIICREDMHVWDSNDPARIERTRPKKLPCGHILHLGCLKSWMERQQVCPTCRRSVVINDAATQRNGDAVMFRFGANAGGGIAPGAAAGAPDGGAGANGQPNLAFPQANGQAMPAAGPNGDVNHNHNQQAPPPANNGGAFRMFNFGPFRLGLAQGRPQDVQEIARRLGMVGRLDPHGGNNIDNMARAEADHAAPNNFGAPNAAGIPDGFMPAGPATHGFPSVPTIQSLSTSTESIFADLRAIEQRIERGTLELQVASEEAQALRLMLLELQRIREGQSSQNTTAPATAAAPDASGSTSGAPQETRSPESQAEQQPASQSAETATQTNATATPNEPQVAPNQTEALGQPPGTVFGYSRVLQPQPGLGPYVQRTDSPTSAAHFTADRNAPAIPAGSSELPPGVQIPAGWSLLPLHRFDSSILNAADPNTAQPGPSNQESQATSTPGQAAAPGSAEDTTSLTTPTWGGPAQLFGGSSQPANATTQEQDDPGEGSSSPQRTVEL